MDREIRVGTSGWTCPHWRNIFYPLACQKSRWLEYYTEHFDRPAPRKPRPKGRGQGELYKNGNLPYRVRKPAKRTPPGRAGRLHTVELNATFYRSQLPPSLPHVRLHGSKKLYASDYSEEELQAWAQKIRQWGKDTYLYFDNDFEGHAVRNAKRLKAILGSS
jgi:uncharacterized protein YecE (DUF72 family)